jgi:hypothetical protein
MVYLFKVTDDTKFKAWAQKNSFDIPLEKFSSLPIVKTSELYPTVAKSSGTYTYNPKSSKKTLLVDFKSTSDVRSDYFKSDVIPNSAEPIPYVMIDGYYVNGQEEPSDFVTRINKLCEFLNISMPTVVAVKRGHVPNLDPDKFVPFNDYLKEILEPHLDKFKSFNEAVNVTRMSFGNRYDYNKSEYGWLSWNTLKELSGIASKVNDNDTRNFLLKIGKMIKLSQYKDVVESVKSILPDLEKDCDDGSGFRKEIQKFMTDYPMLSVIDSSFVKDKYKTFWSDYINLVDANKSVTV